jgi:hypothetical protein
LFLRRWCALYLRVAVMASLMTEIRTAWKGRNIIDDDTAAMGLRLLRMGANSSDGNGTGVFVLFLR